MQRGTGVRRAARGWLATLGLVAAAGCAENATLGPSGGGADAAAGRLDARVGGDGGAQDRGGLDLGGPADLAGLGDGAGDLGPEAPEPPAPEVGPADSGPLDGGPDAERTPPDAAGEDLGPAPDQGPPRPEGRYVCAFPGPADEREVNTWRANTAEIRFAINDLPDPARLAAAFVRFRGWDLDTPGEEGHLQVNDGPRLPLPADPGLTNQHRDEVMQVDPATLRAGANTVRFHAFDRPGGSYFRISQVVIETHGEDPCPVPAPPDDGRTGNGRTYTQGYRDAAYTERRNWVLDCRDYAYTARGEEHEACDDQYRPDGSTHGTATFTFPGVIRDRYGVWVEGRLTENRNPRGALVRVGQAEARVDQRSGGEIAYQRALDAVLEGEVQVVIDSTRENGSDSVRQVELRPVRD